MAQVVAFFFASVRRHLEIPLFSGFVGRGEHKRQIVGLHTKNARCLLLGHDCSPRHRSAVLFRRVDLLPCLLLFEIPCRPHTLTSVQMREPAISYLRVTRPKMRSRMHKIRVDPSLYNMVQTLRARDISEANLTSHLRPEPGTMQRPCRMPFRTQPVRLGAPATSEDLGINARSQTLAAKSRSTIRSFLAMDNAACGKLHVSRHNEPSGYELGNKPLANPAVWVEMPSETFVCGGAPVPFSLSCSVRHLMQVQGSLAVSPCSP